MKQNVGLINAIVRITAGFTVLTWATAKLVRRPHRSSHLLVAMLGGLCVAEGIVRFCPLTYLFEEKINMQDQSQHTDQNEQGMESINPS